MTKKERLKHIIELIESEEIATQEELTARLIAKGYEVSQSTVSRDLNELNLIKVEGKTKNYKYAKADLVDRKGTPQMLGLLKQIITSVEFVNNLVVIKTLVGSADSAGIAIDGMHFPEVLGTIAGDDTLLIVARTNSDAEVIVKTLKTL